MRPLDGYALMQLIRRSGSKHQELWCAETAVRDVDILNLLLNAGGALVLLASAAATLKYLQLRRQPLKAKVEKKTT